MKKFVFKNGTFVTSFDMNEPIESHPEYNLPDVSIWYASIGAINFKQNEYTVINPSTGSNSISYYMTAQLSDIPKEVALNSIRYRRSQLLSQCDWTVSLDAPINEEVKQAWITYRQQLRDLPDLFVENPTDVQWPVPPNKK